MSRSGKFFNEWELSCKCCGGFPDENGVDDRLVAVLDHLREQMGGPLEISCAYRCPEHNAEVHGVPNSQHVLGTAADILCPDYLSWENFVWYLENCTEIPGVISKDEISLGFYRSSLFAHLDVRGYAARWTEDDY